MALLSAPSTRSLEFQIATIDVALSRVGNATKRIRIDNIDRTFPLNLVAFAI